MPVLSTGNANVVTVPILMALSWPSLSPTIGGPELVEVEADVASDDGGSSPFSRLQPLPIKTADAEAATIAVTSPALRAERPLRPGGTQAVIMAAAIRNTHIMAGVCFRSRAVVCQAQSIFL